MTLKSVCNKNCYFNEQKMYFWTQHYILNNNKSLIINHFCICSVYLFRGALYELILILHKDALVQWGSTTHQRLSITFPGCKQTCFVYITFFGKSNHVTCGLLALCLHTILFHRLSVLPSPFSLFSLWGRHQSSRKDPFSPETSDAIKNLQFYLFWKIS